MEGRAGSPAAQGNGRVPPPGFGAALAPTLRPRAFGRRSGSSPPPADCPAHPAGPGACRYLERGVGRRHRGGSVAECPDLRPAAPCRQGSRLPVNPPLKVPGNPEVLPAGPRRNSRGSSGSQNLAPPCLLMGAGARAGSLWVSALSFIQRFWAALFLIPSALRPSKT